MVDSTLSSPAPLPATLPRADQALLHLGRRLQADGYRFITPTPLTHQRVNARTGHERTGKTRL